MKQRYAKLVVIAIFATMAIGIAADGWIGTNTVEVPLRKFGRSGSAQHETPETLARYSRDDALGGGMTVLGTYYIEVKANGHPLRLQLVRRSCIPNFGLIFEENVHVLRFQCRKGPIDTEPITIEAQQNF